MSGASRHVWRIDRPGSLKRLKQAREALPPPAEGEVQVAVEAIGLNFADIFAIMGLYSATPAGSFIPGLEYAGRIVELGKGVKQYALGDKVMGVTRFGGYASRVNIDTNYIQPIPRGWSMEEAAAYLVQGLTAWYGLFTLGDLRPGQTVLIHSAAGGVGILAGRMARRIGAFTIGTVGKPAKLEVLRNEGMDRAIVRGPDFKADLESALEGRPLNLVMECIGGKIFRESFDALTPTGRMITYGSASFTPHGWRPSMLKLLWRYLRRPKIDPMKLPTENKSVMGFNLIWLYEQSALMRQILEEMNSMELPPPVVGKIFPFEGMIDALRFFQSGQSIGKVVVKPESEIA